MVLGALTPSDGEVTVSCERIGYCPQQSSIDQFIKTSKLLEVLIVKIHYLILLKSSLLDLLPPVWILNGREQKYF